MSSGSSQEKEDSVQVLELFVAETISSEDPPQEEWSSLILRDYDENNKLYLYDEGLYDPGSGEVCAKYIPLSDSAILRHPFYDFPAICDPGIENALLSPTEKPYYPDDGQALYLATCLEMAIRPVDRFYQGLLLSDIDLSYYNVRSTWIRAMAIALRYNKSVKTLNLMDNFLNNDACYHLGEMLETNSILSELDLSGCRIGDNGLHCILIGLRWNRSLKKIFLDRNELSDAAGDYLAEVLTYGKEFFTLTLSHNNITANALQALTVAFETNNSFRCLNLSWNSISTSPLKTSKFLIFLSENTKLREVNLSWAALSGDVIAVGIKSLLKAPQLRILNLSNNKLYDQDMKFVNILGKAKRLQSLNLSFNPLSPEMALKLIEKMKVCAKLEQLLLENIDVSPAFIENLHEILKLKPVAEITFGRVIVNFKPKGPDMRDLLLNRIETLLKLSKKGPADIALIVLQLAKNGIKMINSQEFLAYCKSSGGSLDGDIVDSVAAAFPGSPNAKLAVISVDLLVDFIRRKWPDRHLPPTPPPEPELPVKEGKGKKNKKGAQGGAKGKKKG